MKGYQADAAIHEAVEYIRNALYHIDPDGEHAQDLIHLLDILGASIEGEEA